MKLLRLHVRAFRAIREGVALEGLGPGLNLVAGDNEAGKSTLLDALRTVLFERHRVSGSVAARMLPYDSKVRPEIEAELEVAGTPIAIRKAFVQRPEAELRTARGTFEGEEAEKELEALLGHRIPARGESKSEHQGVHALLWVKQGEVTSLAWNDPARSKLEAALERQVGEVLGGSRGEQLLARVRAMYEEHTDKRGNPRGARKKLAEKIARLEEELDGLDATLRAFESLLDALDRDERALAELRTAGTLEAKERAFRELDVALLAYRGLEAKKNDAEQAARLARAELDKVRAEKVARDQRVDEAAAKRRSAEQLATETADAEKALAPVAEADARIDEALLRASSEARAGRARLDDADVRARLASHAEQLAGKRKLRKKVAKKARAIDAVRARLDASVIDEAKLGRLLALREATRIAEARLDATATLVTLEGELAATREDGTAWPAGAAVRVLEPTTIRLGEQGTIRIEPASAGRDARAEAHEGAKRALDTALAELGQGDVEAAIAAAEARRRDEADLRASERELLFDAPMGLDALDDEIARLESEVGDADLPDAREAELARMQARASLEATEQALEAAMKAKTEASRAHVVARETWLDRRSRLDEVLRQAKELEERLEAARTSENDDALRARIAGATARLDAAESARVEATAKSEAAGGSALVERHAAAQREHRVVAETTEKLERAIREHRIALAHNAAQETGERRAETIAELERARAEHRKLERTAASVTVLRAVLDEIASEGRARFLEPVLDRVRPYLDALFPGATLELGDGLRLVALKRGDARDPYDALSMGTQEQLAVLARLAFADLLAEQGEAPPIVLDDALVYSDPERFARMKTILEGAAKRHQILVLTCRKDLWSDVNAREVTMVELEPIAP